MVVTKFIIDLFKPSISIPKYHKYIMLIKASSQPNIFAMGNPSHVSKQQVTCILANKAFSTYQNPNIGKSTQQ
jgi:hypothetical protein